MPETAFPERRKTMLLPSDPSFRVTVRDLTKSYGDSLVLDHVSLDLESG